MPQVLQQSPLIGPGDAFPVLDAPILDAALAKVAVEPVEE